MHRNEEQREQEIGCYLYLFDPKNDLHLARKLVYNHSITLPITTYILDGDFYSASFLSIHCQNV